MGGFVVGEVVAVPFPFSDLSGRKLRPAVIVAVADFGYIIFCQITSKDRSKHGAIKISPDSFQEGSLPITSYARPDKLFTGESSIIAKSRGKLTDQTKSGLLKSIRQIFTE
jgi:mRNA interferase MazF